MVAGCAGATAAGAAPPPAPKSRLAVRMAAATGATHRPDVECGLSGRLPDLRADGELSSNEEFWKRVDGQAVDVGVYDRLFKNGIRVAWRPTGWDYFKALIDQNPASAQRSFCSGREVRAAELEMGKEVLVADLCSSMTATTN